MLQLVEVYDCDKVGVDRNLCCNMYYFTSLCSLDFQSFQTLVESLKMVLALLGYSPNEDLYTFCSFFDILYPGTNYTQRGRVEAVMSPSIDFISKTVTLLLPGLSSAALYIFLPTALSIGTRHECTFRKCLLYKNFKDRMIRS